MFAPCCGTHEGIQCRLAPYCEPHSPVPGGGGKIEIELQSHLAPNIGEGITVGISQDAVRRDALLRFGSPAAVKERVGMADMALFLENIASDIPQAVRQLCKSPGLAATSQSKLTGKLQNWLD